MSRPPHPPNFTGEDEDPRAELHTDPKSFRTKMIARMTQNKERMRLYATSGWYYDVLPDGSQHFDWHAFPINIPSTQSQWMVSEKDVRMLRGNGTFCQDHLSTMVYWLSACGYDAVNCVFFDRSRIVGGDLRYNPRVAKFIHSLHLFAYTPESDYHVQEIIDVYQQLAKSVAYFLAELKFYGQYVPNKPKPDDLKYVKSPDYITPGEFITDAKLGKGADIHEENARLGLNTSIEVPKKKAIKDALEKFITPIPPYTGHSYKPTRAESTEGWSVWMIGAIGVGVLGALLLMWKLTRRRRK